MHKKFSISLVFMALLGSSTMAETIEPIKYGNMDSWITRNITESKLIGGKKKVLYAIGPTKTIDGNVAYVADSNNPWASCNVMANVCGVVKTSNAVTPAERSGNGKCAKMSTVLEECKVIGLVNIKVLVSGSIFLGKMLEPIKSASNPYSKMEMGVAFTRRPKYLQFDYNLYNPETGVITKASGTSVKTSPGTDNAEVFIILQQRWEDKDGNLFAKRVGTGRERYQKSTGGWVNNHRIEVKYGDITGTAGYKDYMGLIPSDRSYYAKNSKGKMVPVKEVGWADANAVPTHLLVMASSGCGKAYEGTLGMEFSVDNLALVF